MNSKEIPMEAVNEILFGEETDPLREESENESTEPKIAASRKVAREFKLTEVPYYKKPAVQIALIVLLAYPILWLIWSVFGGSSNSPATAEKANPYQKENEQLKVSLVKAREEIEKMKIQSSVYNQEQELKIIEPKPIPEPKPVSEPEPVKVVQAPKPIRPTAQSRVVYRTPAPRRNPVPQQVTEPEIAPMEQWLAQAQRGHSISSFHSTHSHQVMASVPTPRTLIESQNQQNPPQYSIPVNPESNPELIAANLLLSSPSPIPQTPLFDEGRLRAIRNNEQPLLDDERLNAIRNNEQPLWDEGRLRAIRNNEPTNPQYIAAASDSINISPVLSGAFEFENSIGGSEQNSTTREGEEISPVEESTVAVAPSKLLDMGSEAEGTLTQEIVWTGQGFDSERNYILYLEDGFKNSVGIEVIPPGTRLIAQISKVSPSGLFSLKISHILRGFDQPKIDVPPGTLEIVAQDGSPLRANLKQEGNSNFLSEVVAPGVEAVLNSSANNLTGSYYGVSSDPLSAGASGVARSTSNLIRQRMRGTGRSSRNLSYFVFEGDQTVRVVVNEDLILP